MAQPLSYNISLEEFRKIAKYVYDEVGIHLADHKMNLVKGRLSKRLRYFGFSTFLEYYEYLVRDDSGEELLMLTNEISTNVTSFLENQPNGNICKKSLTLYKKTIKKKRSVSGVQLVVVVKSLIL